MDSKCSSGHEVWQPGGKGRMAPRTEDSPAVGHQRAAAESASSNSGAARGHDTGQAAAGRSREPASQQYVPPATREPGRSPGPIEQQRTNEAASQMHGSMLGVGRAAAPSQPEPEQSSPQRQQERGGPAVPLPESPVRVKAGARPCRVRAASRSLGRPIGRNPTGIEMLIRPRDLAAREENGAECR